MDADVIIQPDKGSGASKASLMVAASSKVAGAFSFQSSEDSIEMGEVSEPGLERDFADRDIGLSQLLAHGVYAHFVQKIDKGSAGELLEFAAERRPRHFGQL